MRLIEEHLFDYFLQAPDLLPLFVSAFRLTALRLHGMLYRTFSSSFFG